MSDGNEVSHDDDLTPVRSLSYEVFEAFCILACAGMAIELSYGAVVGLSPVIDEPWAVLTLAVIVVMGMNAADLVAGFIHYLCDTVGDKNTPIVGPTMIQTFREHHALPKAMVHHHFIETNGAPAAALLPVMLFFRLLTPATATGWGCAFFATFTVCSMAVNTIHKWAHAVDAPKLARFLQRWRIILNPDDHARHHTPPHETHYLIMFGWLNGSLDRFRVFFGITRIIKWLDPSFVRTAQVTAVMSAEGSSVERN